MRIRDEGGRLLALERYAVAGERLAAGAAQIARWPAQGSVVVAHRGPARDAILAALRTALAPTDSFYGGASVLPNGAGVGVRLLAADGARLRRGLEVAWQAMRLALYGAPPAPRRK